MSRIRFRATVQSDGTIRPEEGVSLPEGEVEVTVWPVPAEPPSTGPNGDQADQFAATRKWLLEMADRAEREFAGLDLPADLAENHDHYAHGKPRE